MKMVNSLCKLLSFVANEEYRPMPDSVVNSAYSMDIVVDVNFRITTVIMRCVSLQEYVQNDRL